MSTPVTARLATQTTFEPPRTPDARDTDAPSRSSGVRRFTERFALIAFGLYHIPLALNNYPSFGGGGFGDGLAVRWGHVFTVPGIWVARHMLGVAGSMPGSTVGDNGDVAEEFGRLLICVVAGLVGAAIWSFADRRRPGSRWVPEALRVMLRYAIALGLISYGIGKIVPMQFPPLRASQLEQRLGDMVPQQLLWTFMEYSRPYAFFGGLMECVVVGLMCIRRTTTVGALMCVVVMANVALLNWSYNVPVKLFSVMLVLSAAVLVLYDARRLTAVFVMNRGVPPSSEASFLHERVSRAWRWAMKTLVVGGAAVSSLATFLPMIRARAENPELAGAWQVTSVAGPTTWHRLTIDQYVVLIRTGGDADIVCYRQPNPDGHALTLKCADGQTGALSWQRAGGSLRISGTFDGAPASVTAAHVDTSYPLLRDRFRLLLR